MYRPNLKFVVLPIPEIIAIEFLGGGGEAVGVGNGTVRKSVGDFL